MLLDILHFLRREKYASNQQIARHFFIDLETLQPLLDIWVHKKRITPCKQPLSCGKICGKCRPVIYYSYQA